MNWMRSTLEYFYDALFGCRHDKQTRPFTLENHTYTVCLDCGGHVFYSAERMEPLTGREVRRLRRIDAGEVRIFPQPGRGPQLVPSPNHKSDAVA
jgi:hypothetical protein